MRLRSRQVNCRIGSMPAADQHGGGDRRAHMGAGAGAVGDVDGVGQPAQRQRLCSRSSRSQETGGMTSAVMTKRPARRSSARLAAPALTRMVRSCSLAVVRGCGSPTGSPRSQGGAHIADRSRADKAAEQRLTRLPGQAREPPLKGAGPEISKAEPAVPRGMRRTVVVDERRQRDQVELPRLFRQATATRSCRRRRSCRATTRP